MSGSQEIQGVDTFTPTNPNFKWYTIITQSGMEKKAKSTLEERIKKLKLEESFGKIIIPTQFVEKIDDKGKKKQVEHKLMPGYIFIEMDMNDKTFICVKDTPKISNFLGATNTKQPPAVSPEEVDKVLNRALHAAKVEAAKPKVLFEKGDKVKVIDGPFTNFTGEVDEVKAEKSKLRVLISVFGRPTPVELEFSKVEKSLGT